MDFPTLIAPVSLENFFTDYWEWEPLHCARGDNRYYESVITSEDLLKIISSNDLRYPALELAKNGAYLPHESFTRNIKNGSNLFAAVPDLAKVQAEYRIGATIVLPALHRTWPGLKSLCKSLDIQFDHPAHANAYLTPGNSTGFTPHYDTHEVFVMQLSGTRHWRVYKPPLALPHRSQPFNPESYRLPARPDYEFDLSPGDLLYLPRGYVHTAETGVCNTTHVTIGITVYTWIELLSELVSTATELESFRKALPAGFAKGDAVKADLDKSFSERLAELLQQIQPEPLSERFTRRVRSVRIPDPSVFQLNVRVIGPESLLKSPDTSRYTVTTKDGKTILHFDGRVLKLPDAVRSTLDAICIAKTFRLIDLPKHLDPAAILAFVRYLHDEGFLANV